MEKERSNLDLNLIEHCERNAISIETGLARMDEKIKRIPKIELESLNEYIEPREKISEIIKFYETYIHSHKTIKEMIQNIEELDIKRHKIAIEEYQKFDYFDYIDEINQEIEKLEEYNDIIIVKDVLKIAKPFFINEITTSKNAFLKSIEETMPSCNESQIFLIKKLFKYLYIDEFLTSYIKSVYKKLKFSAADIKIDKCVEKANNLHDCILNVDESNNLLFENEIAEFLTKSIADLLIINLKQNIGNLLMNLDKRNKPSDIGIISLLFRVFEPLNDKFAVFFNSLSELEDECLKLCNNLMITHIQNIALSKPQNKHCDAESFVLQSRGILLSFDRNPKFASKFLANFEALSSKNTIDVKKEIGAKCFKRIEENAEDLSGVKKKVYLINNYHVLRTIFSGAEGENLNHLINDAKESIFILWKDECIKRRGKDITKFINTNLEIQNQLYLPEEIRNEIILKLKQIIFDELANSPYNESEDALNEKLKNLFVGAKEN